MNRDPNALIGDRTCGNCDRPLSDHCLVHLVPCCPGKCPGVSWWRWLLSGGQ